MTPPVLLTAPTSLTLNVDHHPHHRATPDCHGTTQRPGPFSPALFLPRADPTGGTTFDLDDTDAYPCAVLPRQWSGAPIRAVAPLPRRKRVPVVPPSHPTMGHAVPANATRMHAVARATESEGETDLDKDKDDDDDDDVEIERRRGRPARAPRYCAYESITAAEGLGAWSFEELRVECYAQSLVARGTTPSPAFQPSLAIPPAFVPRIVSRY